MCSPVGVCREWRARARLETVGRSVSRRLPFEGGLFLNNSSFAAAAAHGLPTISTRAPTVEPAFLDGENVILCPPGEAAAIASAIRAVADDGVLRERLRTGALAAARDWFDWDTTVERTMEAFGYSGTCT